MASNIAHGHHTTLYAMAKWHVQNKYDVRVGLTVNRRCGKKFNASLVQRTTYNRHWRWAFWNSQFYICMQIIWRKFHHGISMVHRNRHIGKHNFTLHQSDEVFHVKFNRTCYTCRCDVSMWNVDRSVALFSHSVRFNNIPILNCVHSKIFQQCMRLRKIPFATFTVGYADANVYPPHVAIHTGTFKLWTKARCDAKGSEKQDLWRRRRECLARQTKLDQKFHWEAQTRAHNNTKWTVNSSENGSQFQALVYSHKSVILFVHITHSQQPRIVGLSLEISILNAVWLLITFNFHYFDEIIIKQSNFNTNQTHSKYTRTGTRFWFLKFPSLCLVHSLLSCASFVSGKLIIVY